jgi:uronate dehydrogenase
MEEAFLKKRILFTGAAGRVGHLLRPLLRQTFALRLCDIVSIAPEYPDEEAVIGDLADCTFSREVVSGVDGVVHLAALVAPVVTFEDTLNPNYRAVLSLLEACRRADVRRLVFASSHHIVGLLPSNEQYREETIIAPDSYYGLSKAFGEAACSLYAHRFGISTLVIRIGNADPKIVDGRRERLWISGRDLAQLVTIGLTHEQLGFEIVYGVSNCPSPIFLNEAAARLGYRPVDNAADNHAPAFRPVTELAPEEGVTKTGGFFAVNALPEPLVRS